MVTDLNLDIEIIGCPVVREPDGLAKSSRNTYLNKEERQAAIVLSRSLAAGKEIILSGERNAETVRQAILREIEKEPLAKADYVEIVDSDTISPVDTLNHGVLAAIAVYIGRTRLIDNFIIDITSLEKN